jgi:hypothetical protein
LSISLKVFFECKERDFTNPDMKKNLKNLKFHPNMLLVSYVASIPFKIICLSLPPSVALLAAALRQDS